MFLGLTSEIYIDSFFLINSTALYQPGVKIAVVCIICVVCLIFIFPLMYVIFLIYSKRTALLANKKYL